MTKDSEAGRLLARATDDMDAAKSLVLAADMACSDLDNMQERTAIKEVLYAARQELAKASERIESARTALQAEAAQ